MPGKDPARGARDDGTRDFAGADRGQPGGGRRGGNGGGPKQGPNRDGSTIDVNPKGVGNFSGGRPESMAAAARQVYSKPVGPTMSGDPMGGVSHFSQEGNALDKMLGYDNIGERVAAYQNNPNASHNAANSVTMMPNFPQATPGYVAGQFADMLAGLVPGGGILTSGYRAGNFGLTGDTDGPFTDAAEAMGASRGPRGPDVPGGGFEGRKGGETRIDGGTAYAGDANALPGGTAYAGDANALPGGGSMADTMENMLEYTNGAATPKKIRVPKAQIPSPFPTGSSSVVVA